jgi:hypothetical protein
MILLSISVVSSYQILSLQDHLGTHQIHIKLISKLGIKLISKLGIKLISKLGIKLISK